jgi:SAM-dependent methyltransferase
MKKITYDIEWDLERSHWWFIGRRRLLKSLLSSLGVRKDSLIIDVGCGVGSNLKLLKSIGLKVIGIDFEIYSLFLAKRRFSTVPFVHGDLLSLPFKTNSIETIIATDILEHLDDDSIGIKEIHRALTRGGTVILTVPAFNSLWGIQDIVGMHKRRYSKNEFLKKIEQEGFTVFKSSYFNFFLFFPILLGRHLIRLLGLKIESENKINSPFINLFLKTIFSIEPYLLKYFSFPFGVSVFCIAKKS